MPIVLEHHLIRSNGTASSNWNLHPEHCSITNSSQGCARRFRIGMATGSRALRHLSRRQFSSKGQADIHPKLTLVDPAVPYVMGQFLQVYPSQKQLQERLLRAQLMHQTQDGKNLLVQRPVGGPLLKRPQPSMWPFPWISQKK
jgi:hypothetical protein